MTKAKASNTTFYSIILDKSEDTNWTVKESNKPQVMIPDVPANVSDPAGTIVEWPILIAFHEQKIVMHTPNMRKVITGTLEEFKDWAEVYELLLTQLTATGYRITKEIYDYTKFKSFEDYIAHKV